MKTAEQIIEEMELDPEDKPECWCCRSTGVHFNPLEPNKIAIFTDWNIVCDICYNTLLSVYCQFPRRHTDGELETMKIVAYTGNEILKKLDILLNKKK